MQTSHFRQQPFHPIGERRHTDHRGGLRQVRCYAQQTRSKVISSEPWLYFKHVTNGGTLPQPGVIGQLREATAHRTLDNLIWINSPSLALILSV
ncbi:hypothetical protein Ciccas_004205 [Cichlidogyrus casuarinus]|uniref:Uncharacterized protein n=1 Tax=Cichlidogyrus casuarinus TaxID=1844966 RepID=A0ABD2QC95_9PLAT